MRWLLSVYPNEFLFTQMSIEGRTVLDLPWILFIKSELPCVSQPDLPDVSQQLYFIKSPSV